MEDYDIVMPMYILLECSGNYSMKSGSLLNYYIDELNDDASDDNYEDDDEPHQIIIVY